MERCAPVEMRRNLELVEVFKQMGMDFVPIPVLNESQKAYFLNLMQRQLDIAEKMAEKDEKCKLYTGERV